MRASSPPEEGGSEGQAPAPPSISEISVRLAVEGSTDCIKVLSLDGSLEYMNEGGMCVMEIDDFGPFQGACWPDFWHGEESAKAHAALDRARAGGVGRFQGYTATAKGNVRFWDVTVSPVPGPDGKPVSLLSVSRDVTAQREAEGALAEAWAHVDRTLEASQVATYDWDLAEDRLRGNRLFDDFFGLPPHPEGSPIAPYFARIHPDDVEEVRRAINEAFETGDPYEVQYRVYGEGGRLRDVLARGEAISDATGRPLRLFGVILDVTRRVRAERALATERERLVGLLDRAPAFSALLEGSDLRFTFTSRDYLTLVGHRNLLGLPVREALPEVAGQGFFEMLDGVMATGEPKGGQELPIELQRVPNGPLEDRFVDFIYQATLDADGRPDGVFVHGVDVTEQTFARRFAARANEELETRVLARTAELQRAIVEAEGFNYSISHDLRTPLRAISMTASVLIEELGPDLSEEHRELLLRQTHNASRMGSLIDDLLRLSRLARAAMRRQRIDMTAEARSVAGQTEGPCAIQIQDGMFAEADRSLVRSVLQNLIGNAYKFSPDGGTVRVGQDGGTFWVRDEGVGFNASHAARIFLPFERLVADDAFPGTGIGLANVKRIVERHGGRVWFESEPGKGATFFFTLV